jgi:hypothetical protein
LAKPPPRPGKKRASTWGPRLARSAAERTATKRTAFEAIGAISSRELVHIHETADVTAAEDFWARLLGVSRDSFDKVVLKRHNPKTNRRNRFEAYHGCLVIRVADSARRYRHVDGWWQGIVAAVRSGTIEP